MTFRPAGLAGSRVALRSGPQSMAGFRGPARSLMIYVAGGSAGRPAGWLAGSLADWPLATGHWPKCASTLMNLTRARAPSKLAPAGRESRVPLLTGNQSPRGVSREGLPCESPPPVSVAALVCRPGPRNWRPLLAGRSKRRASRVIERAKCGRS